MMTILFLSQTLAFLPNSRLNTPIVPGPQTSWVRRTSVFTQTFSPGATWALPLARASSFSVNVIEGHLSSLWAPSQSGRILDRINKINRIWEAEGFDGINGMTEF